jgi:hypothetical protein
MHFSLACLTFLHCKLFYAKSLGSTSCIQLGNAIFHPPNCVLDVLKYDGADVRMVKFVTGFELGVGFLAYGNGFWKVVIKMNCTLMLKKTNDMQFVEHKK